VRCIILLFSGRSIRSCNDKVESAFPRNGGFFWSLSTAPQEIPERGSCSSKAIGVLRGDTALDERERGVVHTGSTRAPPKKTGNSEGSGGWPRSSAVQYGRYFFFSCSPSGSGEVQVRIIVIPSDGTHVLGGNFFFFRTTTLSPCFFPLPFFHDPRCTLRNRRPR